MKRAHLLKQALTSQEELVDLVNRVLDATTVVGEIPLAKLEGVLAHLAPGDVQAYTIRLQVPEQVLVWADPQFLREVLLNLLTNVFKYVPTQTEIRIEAAQADPSSPVCLSVQDAGPGSLPKSFLCSLRNLCVSSVTWLAQRAGRAWDSTSASS